MKDVANNTYKNYLLDLIHLIKEEALNAQKESKKSGSDYDRGIVFAYHSVVSLLQLQAHAFQIDLKELKLDDIDPVNDLLIGKETSSQAGNE